uniref:CCHC-type domain-containing protein n=1 Tax=Tanacetum cinerariifolium TaxID=118510 RepID=A0A6L2LES8_TANCI|nr:hypothetical protein [Tanacetum cinerariifolium]
MIDYALWEVIKNGTTLPKTKVVKGVTTEMPITSAKEKAQRRLEVKARSNLMMGIPNEHQLKFNSINDAKKLLEAVEKRFGRNAVTKKSQRNLLKQQYKNFTAPSLEMLDQTFDRLQKLVSQLELLEEKLLQEDARRFLRKTGRKLTVNGNETIGLDKSNVECYNCHKKGYFARECRALRNQNNKHKESSRRSAEEGSNYALMAFSSSSSDSEKRLGHENYNAVPPPCTGNFMPLTLDLSFTGLDEFVNKPVVENCKAKFSKEEPNVVRKNDDVPIIEEWVSNNEEEDVSQPKIEKKIVRPSIAKIKFVKFKQQDRTTRKIAKQGNRQIDLQDQGVIDSGCSRYMTGKISYVTDYEEIDGGYVAFRGNPKGEKITGKDYLGKLNGKANEVLFVGYSLNSKAFRVFNSGTRIVKENLHIRFSKSTPNVVGTKASDNAGQARKKTEPVKVMMERRLMTIQEKKMNVMIKKKKIMLTALTMLILTFDFSSDDEDDGVVADMNNLDKTIQVSLIPTTKINKDHHLDHVIGDLQTRKMSKNLEEHGFVSTIQQRTNYKDLQNCLFACFLSQKEPKKIEEEVYVCQPPGFEDPDFPDMKKHCMDYIKLLELEVKTASTPIETQKPLLKDKDGKEVNVHMYRYQVNPKVSHLHAVKRIFRYLVGQPKLGIWYLKDSLFDLVAYIDSDYAGASLDRKSTTGGCQFFDFWSTAMAKTINEEAQLHAKVDGKKIIVTESSVRRYLRLADDEGIDCLLNFTIFEQISLMGKPTRKDTQVPQPSGLTESVANETVHKELGDRLMRATTTAFSLEAEQDSGNITKTQSKATPNQPSSQGTDSESSGDEESLGEDGSKQERRIDAIDADEYITMVSAQDDADKEMFDVDVLGGEEMFVAGQTKNVVEEVLLWLKHLKH